jgi:hypothetical protein
MYFVFYNLHIIKLTNIFNNLLSFTGLLLLTDWVAGTYVHCCF